MTGTRVYRSRTKEELKAALQLFIDRKAVLHVPVDEEHDADCIIADGIYELDDLRADIKRLKGEYAFCEEAARRLDADNKRLRDALDRDKTGLAAALAAVVKLCDGYSWATEGRGSYEWDDDEYRKEFGWALENIRETASTALHASGKLADEALR